MEFDSLVIVWLTLISLFPYKRKVHKAIDRNQLIINNPFFDRRDLAVSALFKILHEAVGCG